jgi:hypothetical protein
MKIYQKRGNKNYKERKLLKDLEPYIEKRIAEDPSFSKQIIPATNYQELQKMHSRYIAEDVESVMVDETNPEPIKETENENQKDTMKIGKDSDIQDVEFEETDAVKTENPTRSSSSFIDPFNREEPIVRDYVLGKDSLSKNEPTTEESNKTSFDEPTTFEEAFEIPDPEEPQAESGGKSISTSSSEKKPEREPLNPQFDEMSTGKKKRSTAKFAKYIVEAVSTLSEKGFVWYSNSEINDAKLAEYEMTGEMDLSLLVSLEDGQDVTVKQFFQVQCAKAEEMSKWSDEQKEDMSTALAEVLMEKGVAPSPMQELLLVTLTIIGGQAMTLFTLKSQTNSLLNQLRSMNDEDRNTQSSYEEPYHEKPTYTPEPTVTEQESEPIADDDYEEPYHEDIEQFDEATESTRQISNGLASLTEEEVLISDGNIETKE